MPGRFAVVPAVSFLTPVDPSRQLFSADTAVSVQHSAELLQRHGFSSEWVVAADGPGSLIDAFDVATRRLRTRRGGAAQARNVALGVCSGRWVVPIDADDILEPSGVLAGVRALACSSAGWVGLSRTLLDGEPTAHTFEQGRLWAAGELSEAWSSPFPFHPNSVICDRELLVASGGWPPLSVNEDLAAVLLLAEVVAGRTVAATLTRYRVWGSQQVAAASYAAEKAAAFRVVEQLVNSRRLALGRRPVTAPRPGPAQTGVRR
jgi:hypothetical protein